MKQLRVHLSYANERHLNPIYYGNMIVPEN